MERDLKKNANRLLKKIPKSKFVPYSPYPYGEPGTPDKIGCVDGSMVLIEFKDKGKELKPLQRIRKKEWEDVGAKVHVVDSIEQFRKIIKEGIDA